MLPAETTDLDWPLSFLFFFLLTFLDNITRATAMLV